MVTLRRLSRFAPVSTAGLLLVLVLAGEGGLQEPGWSVSSLARVVTMLCLAASVIAGIAPRRADVRLHASVTFAIFAVTAIGQSRMIDVPNAIYRIGCVLFGLVVVATLRDAHRAARTSVVANRRVSTRGRAGAFIVLGIGWVVVSGLLVRGLPPASVRVERRVTRYFEGFEQAPTDAVGFSSKLQLGSTRGMLRSTKVVMRIDGAPVDYLRGAVLDNYDALHQRWSSSLDEERTESVSDTPLAETSTRARWARSAPVAHGSEARWFLPRDVCDLHTDSGLVAIDESGIAHPAGAGLAMAIAFNSGPSCRGRASALPAPAPWGERDLRLTPKLRNQLAKAGTAMTGDIAEGPGNARAKLEAIEHGLAIYGYSLEVARDEHFDAVIDFLYLHREGHCELFATAMALLARREGIPARLVSGYRVTERNPITHLSIVRERNAHTWVEAWVDGQWEPFDPTPTVELDIHNAATTWDNGTEVLAWAADRVIGFFWDLGLAGTGIGAAAIALLLLAVRRFTQRTGARGADEVIVTARPLPAFEHIEAALAVAGWPRAVSEPLERFARRLVEGGEPWSPAVADALVRYAELRYGGLGEEQIVAQQLEGLATQVRQSVRA